MLDITSAKWIIKKIPSCVLQKHRESVLVMASQAFSSGVGFFYSVWLIKVLSVEEFGVYGIILSVVYFISGFGSALLITPLVVSDVSKNDKERELYYNQSMFVIYVWFVLSGLLCVLFWIVGYFFGFDIRLANATIFCAAAVYLKEYFVRKCYSQKKLLRNLICQIVFFSISMLVLYVFRDNKNAYDFIMLNGVINCVTCLAFLGFRHNLMANFHGFVSELSRLTTCGRKSVVSHILSNIRMSGYNYIVPILIGLNGLAEINSGKIVISVASVIVSPMTQLFIAKIVRNEFVDNKGIRLYGQKLFLFVMLSVIPIFVFVLFGKEHIFNKYQNITVVSLGWIVQTGLSVHRTILEAECVAKKMFSIQSMANLYALMVFLVVIFPCALFFKVYGVILTLWVTEIAAILFITSKKMELR